MSTTPTLWPEITVLERGWLSANNIVFQGPDGAAVVDTGYASQAEQTVLLLEAELGGRPLACIANTHLHSDHCGGNAALQARWPQARTLIPPGQWAHVQQWNPYALSYTPTGQQCPQFRADAMLEPGSEIALGGRNWQIHAAPGHDPHAVLLFEPQGRILISGDALWENGFGVVFPELHGSQGEAFTEVGDTLTLIAQLDPATVIPGHGPVFGDVPAALERARKRLAGFEAAPIKHVQYAMKVLLKYKLLEWQQRPVEQVLQWLSDTPHCADMHRRHFAEHSIQDWAQGLMQSLIQAQAARIEDGVLVNC